jgi:IclR family pca regulon transcriptional regulator
MVVRSPVKKNAARAERPAEGMGGLAKGLAVIEALARRGVLSSADASRAANTTRAAARRCLLTLVDLGYVERIGREFRPLPRLRSLGREGGMREQLENESGPILASGRDQLNESVSLAVLDGDSALFIGRAEAEHIISTGVRVGARLPAYCSATGRVLLGQLDDGKIRDAIAGREFPRRTAKTVTKPSLILRAIQCARHDGYAMTDEELELGMRSIAVPVKCEGKIVAAISTSAYSARMTRAALLKRPLAVLQECARQLEAACFGSQS